HIRGRGGAGDHEVRGNVVAIEIQADAVRREAASGRSDGETEGVGVLERVRAGRINVAELGQIGLGCDKHEEVRQQVAAARDAQSLLAVESDERVVVISVLEIDILKSAPAQASVNREGAQVRNSCVRID